MRWFLVPITIACLFVPVGCHSPYVVATVSNHTAQRIDLVEVDYPSASFGVQALAPGSDFHYRFKVLGSGDMKLIYTDDAHQSHSVNGPFLKEGAEGALGITITSAGVSWLPGSGLATGR